jgi:Glycosyl hydrolase family 71
LKNTNKQLQAGNVNTDHVQKDIDDAYNMGLDGFAVNVGCILPFVKKLLDDMDQYITSNYQYKFFFFISMDVYASGSCSEGPPDFLTTVSNYIGQPSYYTVNEAPLVSTYSSGGKTWPVWHKFLVDASVGGPSLYWIPDL